MMNLIVIMTSGNYATIRMTILFIQLLTLSSVDSFFIEPSSQVRTKCYDTSFTHKRTTIIASRAESSPSTSSITTDPSTMPSRTLERGDLPWSDVQQWALEDNISKFTVTLPSSKKRYAMWRSMAREVTELAGYPIPFLVKMHQRSMKVDGGSNSNIINNSSASIGGDTPGVLPMVDDFEFASNGGLVGRAYGIPGIADGTRINTPPLVAVEQTIPLGYVTTEEDDLGVSFSYELGICASSSVYSLDGTERSSALLSARRLILEGTVDSSRRLVDVARDMQVTGSGLLSDTESNRDLVYLGGATAMLLASATAVGMLSHHLTVNVFWV